MESVFQWRVFLAALGLAMVLEGMPYFLFPEAVKRVAARVPQVPGGALRLLGMLGIVLGLLIVWLSRRFG